jgi:hypothetical protein
MARGAQVACALLLAASAGCQRAGSGPQPETDVALRVDGVAAEAVHVRRGDTVVVAGNGHGDPDWVSARARGTDGRFVSAALKRYPTGELRLAWRDADEAPTLGFYDGAGEQAQRLSEARGVTQIDVMTLPGAPVSAKPAERAGVVLVTAAGEEKAVTPQAIEALEEESIQTGRRRGAQLGALLDQLGIDTKRVGAILLHAGVDPPVTIPGAALRTEGEAVVLRYNKRGELRVFHERGGNTVTDAKAVTRIELTRAR